MGAKENHGERPMNRSYYLKLKNITLQIRMSDIVDLKLRYIIYMFLTIYIFERGY